MFYCSYSSLFQTVIEWIGIFNWKHLDSMDGEDFDLVLVLLHSYDKYSNRKLSSVHTGKKVLSQIQL